MHPWEALFEIFLIFRDPLGAGGAPFWLEKAFFLRSDFLMIFGVRDTSILGGTAAGAGLSERSLAC